VPKKKNQIVYEEESIREEGIPEEEKVIQIDNLEETESQIAIRPETKEPFSEENSRIAWLPTTNLDDPSPPAL